MNQLSRPIDPAKAEMAALDAYLAASRSGDPARTSAAWLVLKAAQYIRSK